MFLNHKDTVQQLLQKKQMMRGIFLNKTWIQSLFKEGKYDSASSVNANIQDLMQTFSKGPGSGSVVFVFPYKLLIHIRYCQEKLNQLLFPKPLKIKLNLHPIFHHL